MDAAYDPPRIRGLTIRTSQAIDALSRLGSGDPSAAEALRTIRLARRNLEDHWMAALRDIERSDAMVSWSASQLTVIGTRRPSSASAGNVPDHLRPGGLGAIPMSDQQLGELLWQLEKLDRKAAGVPTDVDGVPTDDHGAPTDAELDALARELALWVGRDPTFADRLVELSASNMLIGQLLGRAQFPITFVSDLVKRMAAPNGPEGNLDRHRSATAMNTALAELTDDPAACLDVLLDQSTAYALAAWNQLDPTVLSAFVTSGLRDAVAVQPARLQNGFDVLTFLTRAANGPLDGGFNAGMALGLATSMSTYVDVLAPAIVSTGATDTVVVSNDAHGISADFGTYAELQEFFGAMLRDEQARLQLGAMTATWADTTLTAAASRTALESAVTAVSRFTIVILDAAQHEQDEVLDEFRAAQREDTAIVDALTWGVDLAIGSRGASPQLRAGVGLAIDGGFELLTRDDRPDDVVPVGFGEEIRRQMMFAAVKVGVTRPDSFRDDEHPERLTFAQRRRVTHRLEGIESATNAEERSSRIGTLVQNVGDAPALDSVVNLVTTNPTASELAGR